MGRVISIEDEESGVGSRIDIERRDGRAVVTRITISSDDGLPDEIMSALLPYIGLPATAVGVRRQPEPRVAPRRNPQSTPALRSHPARDDHPTRTNGAVAPPPAPVAFSAPEPAATSTPEERPEPPRKAAPAPKPRKQAAKPRRTYRRAPDDAAMAKAIEEVGSASPSRLSAYFEVPAHTVSGWLNRYRARAVSTTAQQGE